MTKILELEQFDEKSLVSWLKDSDVHMVLSHIHQGLQTIYDCGTLKTELQTIPAFLVEIVFGAPYSKVYTR